MSHRAVAILTGDTDVKGTVWFTQVCHYYLLLPFIYTYIFPIFSQKKVVQRQSKVNSKDLLPVYMDSTYINMVIEPMVVHLLAHISILMVKLMEVPMYVFFHRFLFHIPYIL